MTFLALVDAPSSSESMKFPVLCSKRHGKPRAAVLHKSHIY